MRDVPLCAAMRPLTGSCRITLPTVGAWLPSSDQATCRWSTCHRAERFATVSSATSLAQVPGAIRGKHARAQNPDTDDLFRTIYQ